MAELKGIRIKTLRHELGMSQEELAGRVGVSKSAILSYENEKRNPEIKTIAELARALSCTTDYLFGLSDKPTRKDKELSQVPRVQRFLDSIQKLSADDMDYLVEAFTNVTDSLTLDRGNPRRREFVKPIGEHITECAAYIEMTEEKAEHIPKRNAENSLTLNDLAVIFAEFSSFGNRMTETCRKIANIGIEALLHFSVEARQAFNRKSITTDFLKAYRERNAQDDVKQEAFTNADS